MRIMRPAAIATLALLTVAGTASAATINVVGSASYKDTTTTPNALTVDASFDKGSSFNLNLAEGGQTTISDFLTLCIDYTSNKSGSATDNISVTFNITKPGTESGADTGAITETQTGSGFFTTDKGSVTWNSPIVIVLGNGDDLTVALSTPTFKDDKSCGNYDLCGDVNATFSLTKPTTPPPPTNAPEPASLALLGAGLFGLGLTRRFVRR